MLQQCALALVFLCKQGGKFPSCLSRYFLHMCLVLSHILCGKALKIQCFLDWKYSDNGPALLEWGSGEKDVGMRRRKLKWDCLPKTRGVGRRLVLECSHVELNVPGKMRET